LKNPSILGCLVKTHNRVKNLMGKPRTKEKECIHQRKKGEGKKTCSTTRHVLHRKLPLDTRPISRPIDKKICPLSALSANSNSIIRHARLLRYGDATVAPVFRNEHSNRIFESVRQLRCGVPQLLRQHQARTQLPERIRQLRCGAPQLLRHHQGAYTAPPARECTAAAVWGAAATPSSPSAHIAPPPNVCRWERRR